MIKTLFFLTSLVVGGMATTALAQVRNYVPVTREMLLQPDPADWLMFSRTYDAQRFSPLEQVNRGNVAQLRMVWARGMAPGTNETIPIVHGGVLYVVNPGSIVQALDATSGDLLWEYRRRMPDDIRNYIGLAARTKSLAIYEDVILYAAHDGYLVGLDARTGEVRWETQAHDYKTNTMHTSAPVVFEGRVLTGRSCRETREGCFISAHDARTGKEVWKFYTTAAPGEPGGDSWGNLPLDKRIASPWGLPGSYDPARKLVYWGIANPTPYPRLKRHGSADAIPRAAPANAYSNSTVALDVETGKLAWYYQHLPGDDWDEDHTHERVLIRTAFNPDPNAVKWINPRIPRGQQRDVSVSVAEAGGLWVLDRATGEFLWAMPFPYDGPEFNISRIDVETGRTYINWDVVFQKDGDRRLICSFNTKSYWPMAYHPGKNALYVPYHDSCLDMTVDLSQESGFGPRFGVVRPGSDPNAFTGIDKIDMATGRRERIYSARVPGNGAALLTAGDLLFWGDLNRRFRAFDADNGKILWETILGGPIQMSTITYAVNGKQYIAVMTGEGQSATTGLMRQVPELSFPRNHSSLYVFALP